MHGNSYGYCRGVGLSKEVAEKLSASVSPIPRIMFYSALHEQLPRTFILVIKNFYFGLLETLKADLMPAGRRINT